MSKNYIKEIVIKINEIYDLCEEAGYNTDILNKSQWTELLLADALNHEWIDEGQNADAEDELGDLVEYKVTNEDCKSEPQFSFPASGSPETIKSLKYIYVGKRKRGNLTGIIRIDMNSKHRTSGKTIREIILDKKSKGQLANFKYDRVIIDFNAEVIK